MFRIHPALFFLCVLLLLLLASAAGRALRLRFTEAAERESDSLKTLEAAVLALLGLLLGFTFSMALSRYDSRKQLEIAEANNLGTLWLRTSLLKRRRPHGGAVAAERVSSGAHPVHGIGNLA